jgi:hypothetical protein
VRPGALGLTEDSVGGAAVAVDQGENFRRRRRSGRLQQFELRAHIVNSDRRDGLSSSQPARCKDVENFKSDRSVEGHQPRLCPGILVGPVRKGNAVVGAPQEIKEVLNGTLHVRYDILGLPYVFRRPEEEQRGLQLGKRPI